MDPIRKKFASGQAFPFAYNYRDTKNPQSELPDHLHDWYELVYVYEGKGTFFINQTFYEMRKGDVFIIPGDTIHRAFPDKDNPVTSTAIFFSPLLVQQVSLGDSFSYLNCYEQSKIHRNYQIPLQLSMQLIIESCLDHIQHELEHKKTGYRHSIILDLQHMLLQLSRGSDTDSPHIQTDSTTEPLWMKKILFHIDEHLEQDVGLAALSLKASISPAHFSRVFKKLTGMNITEYITTKRIIRAKELLLETDSNISLIAESCGFESLPHFHRMFKRITSLTPAAYKKASIMSPNS
ncbi:AraC family transcriptional regulator [Paenibacillus psychroresistens]|uniref:AraC family transcriptional regulator n=1 Tax=Paenibacillus psychroresistens TaxID=1778678 RepID=A0A6B8RIS5_9BACL|nr:AraC family transcriptional regulator [Paenibacillus psychroresistens]QGQ95286.1 AraC family transcriptional regulator [Paenibacillus psychroresistens]